LHDEITKESIDVGTRNKRNNVNTKDEEKHAMVLQAHHTTKGKLSTKIYICIYIYILLAHKEKDQQCCQQEKEF
jgi:hypothetical protein